jgi:hypothetical protein
MHREVLTKKGAELLPTLSRISGFYRAGGTALALQIGHRLSVDFDLFRDEPAATPSTTSPCPVEIGRRYSVLL